MEAPPRIVARRGLFMVLSIKAAAHAAYYFQASGLEAKRECADGRWIGGSDPLGVNDGSAVDAWTFDQLLRRRSAFGASPNFNRSEGSTGRDFVFSAPKSVSLVWAFAPQDSKRAIETAQNDAVKAVGRTVVCRGVPRKVWQGRPNIEEGQRGCCGFHACGRPNRAACRKGPGAGRRPVVSGPESAHACGRA